MDITEQIAELVRECHEQAPPGTPTRPAAVALVRDLEDGPLLRRLAAEFLVDALARARRAEALGVERGAEASPSAGEGVAPTRPRIPRKGTKARADWERDTPEGRAWAEQEERDWLRSTQMLHGTLQVALNRYAEDLRVQWTAELLDSTFALGDGTVVTWGEATLEQHETRRQVFLNNAHANMEGAARHELAVRELRETGAPTLRQMVSVAA